MVWRHDVLSGQQVHISRTGFQLLFLAHFPFISLVVSRRVELEAVFRLVFLNYAGNGVCMVMLLELLIDGLVQGTDSDDFVGVDDQLFLFLIVEGFLVSVLEFMSRSEGKVAILVAVRNDGLRLDYLFGLLDLQFVYSGSLFRGLSTLLLFLPFLFLVIFRRWTFFHLQ